MTARIVMDAGGGPVVGSITLPGAEVNTPVTLSNADNTDVEGWRFELLDAPKPSPTLNPLPPPTHSNTAVITPDVKGHTIMVRLTTYKDAGRTQIDDVDQQVIRVRFEPPFDWVIPAAQESIEANEIRGWAEDVNRILRDVHQIIDDGGGGGFMIARLIGDLDKVIAPGLSMLYTPDVDLDPATNLELAPEGDMAGIDHRENFNPEYIPVRQSRTVHTQDTLLVDRIRIRGRLRLLGRLRILPTIDGQYVLDKLTDIAPDAGGILGALSPAKFLTAAETRAFTETLTAAQVEAVAIGAAPAAGGLPFHPEYTGNAEPRTGGDVYETGFVHRIRMNDLATKSVRMPNNGFFGPGNPADGDRIGFLNVSNNSDQLTIDANGSNIAMPNGSTAFQYVGRMPHGLITFLFREGSWMPEGGTDLLHWFGDPNSNIDYHLERSQSLRQLVAAQHQANQVYARSTSNSWAPATLSNYSMLVRNTSNITGLVVGTYGVLGRSSSGNVGTIGLGTYSVLARPATGAVTFIPHSSDRLLGRNEAGSLAAQSPYNVRHILAGRQHGTSSISDASLIAGNNTAWLPGGSTSARRAWMHRITSAPLTSVVTSLDVSETSNDQVFEKWFWNESGNPVTWKHLGIGSTQDLIHCPGFRDYEQRNQTLVKLVYNWSANRWYLAANESALRSLEVWFAQSHSILYTDAGGLVQKESVNPNEWLGRNGSNTIGGNAVSINSWFGRAGSGDLQGQTLAVQQLMLRGATDLGSHTVLDSEFVGRPAGGNLGSITKAQAQAILGGAAVGDFVTQAELQALANGLDWQNSVLDKDLVTAPAHGAGDRYIVAGLGGAWSTAAIGDIAESDGAAWSFETPNEGFSATVEDENKAYLFNGAAWVLLANYTGAVVASLYDANTILTADTDDTPAAMAVQTSSLVGRRAGSIEDIAVAAQELLANLGAGLQTVNLVEQSLLLRGAGNLGVQGVPDSRFVGRPAGGDLGAMTGAEARALIDQKAALLGSVVTADATVTTIATYTSAVFNAVTRLRFSVMALQPVVTAETALYEMVALVYRDSVGAASVKLAPTALAGGPFEEDAAWDVTLLLSGNDMHIQVTGAAATTIHWDLDGTAWTEDSNP